MAKSRAVLSATLITPILSIANTPSSLPTIMLNAVGLPVITQRQTAAPITATLLVCGINYSGRIQRIDIPSKRARLELASIFPFLIHKACESPAEFGVPDHKAPFLPAPFTTIFVD